MLGLNHIALIVSSEESLRFYEKLGFREFKRIERSYDTIVFMESGLIVLEIFIDQNHPERVSGPEAKGLRHIAFTVDDLNRMVAELDCEEIKTDWFGNRFTFAKDPDGQPIELKEKSTRTADSNSDFTKVHKKQNGFEISFFDT